jgi:hypothetical protein
MAHMYQLRMTDKHGTVVAWKLAGENPKSSEKYLSQCYFDHHKSHTDYTGSEPLL